ncbi:MAG TPA: hypothetical protein PLB55_08485 [Prosthecobacter sp.]|nr:hypothetical protein [Prosthecobacter sp.]
MNQAQVQLAARLIRRHPQASWLILLVFAVVAGLQTYYACSPPHQIASLISPAKLATLGSRAANPRVQKYVAILENARLSGRDPAVVAADAVKIAGLRGEMAVLTAEAMLRNRVIAERLGCLNPAGLQEMREGRAPTVMKGPYKGDQLSVDHIIPLSVVPELDKVIANLELMPLRMNESKHAKMGARQEDLLKKLRAAGLSVGEDSSVGEL